VRHDQDGLVIQKLVFHRFPPVIAPSRRFALQLHCIIPLQDGLINEYFKYLIRERDLLSSWRRAGATGPNGHTTSWVPMGRWSQALLEDLELSEPLADVIWCLRGPISRGCLLGGCHCDPSNVSYLVDRLGNAGLSNADRHCRPSGDIVSLSSAGLRVRNEIVRAATTHYHCPTLPKDQKHLHDLLAKTINRTPSHPRAGLTAYEG